jgi:hypothetical protein
MRVPVAVEAERLVVGEVQVGGEAAGQRPPSAATATPRSSRPRPSAMLRGVRGGGRVWSSVGSGWWTGPPMRLSVVPAGRPPW